MTEKQLIKKIQQLHRKNEALNITAVKQNHPKVLAAAFNLRPFLGWRRALEKAGLSYDDIRIELLEFCVCEICGISRKRLIAHIIKVHEMTGDEYRDEFPDSEIESEVLRADAREKKGTTQPLAIPHWEPAWSREYCLDRLYYCHSKGISLVYSEARKFDLNLTNVVLRYFGRWSNAVEALGLDPLQECPRLGNNFWTKEKVSNELENRKLQGKPMNIGALLEDNQALAYAATIHFGNYDKALKSIGLNPRQTRKWLPATETDERRLLKILRKIDGLYGDDRLVAVRNLKKNRRLHNIVVQRYGTWGRAAKAAGVDSSAIALRSWYPRKEDVLEELKARFHAGRGVGSHALAKENSALRAAIRKHYGVVWKAVEAAGIDSTVAGVRRKELGSS